MDNNGPLSVRRITAQSEFNDGMNEASVSAAAIPKKYTIMSIHIFNNTPSPIRLTEAGWPLTGTSLEAFEIAAHEQETLQIPYFRDFSSNGVGFSKKEFAPITQSFSYITDDGLICALRVRLNVDIGFGVLHPTLRPYWSTKVLRTGNKNSNYSTTATISENSKEPPFSFDVNLTIG